MDLQKGKGNSADYFISTTILLQRSLLRVCITLAWYIKILHPVCLFQGIKVNYHNMNLLCKIGGYFSQQCLSETTDFRFPMEITKVTQKNVTMIIYEFLQQIFQLFSKNLPVGAWPTSKIEKFQNGLHQQIEELEICLSEELSKARNSFQTWILKSTTFSMKKYFRRITNFPKKQYSHCSWEVVQMELRTCLIIFDSLMKKHMA
ncbi:LOW QUALITY PROTEIN: interferon kappa [Phoenicopterus ruber ruber]